MNNKVLVIVGPTASGKSSLAIQLALKLNGEIVSADSMQIYKGLDIATAKPNEKELQLVPHHLISTLDPSENFSVAEYSSLARSKIDDILQRNKFPILVGGTGLYIDSIIQNIQYQENEYYSDDIRNYYSKLADSKGNDYVWKLLNEMDEEGAKLIHPNNLKRVIRAIEIIKLSGKSIRHFERLSKQVPSPYDFFIIGLRASERSFLNHRIDQRVDKMIADGLIEEVKKAYDKGLGKTASQAIGYKELFDYFDKKCSLDKAIESVKIKTHQYAKRQMTWFNRNENIHWIPIDVSQDYLSEALNLIFSNWKDMGLNESC